MTPLTTEGDVCPACDVTFKDFLAQNHGNRVGAAIEAARVRMDARLGAGLTTVEALNRTKASMDDTSWSDLVSFQSTQAQAHAMGLISDDEARTLYVIIGGESPSVERWRERSLPEQVTVYTFMEQLMGAMRRRGG